MMDGSGVGTEAIGVMIAFASGLAKMTQAGFGDRIGKPGAMLLALGYSALGVVLWALSQPTIPDRVWAFGLAQAIVIVALSCVGVFSATQTVMDRAGSSGSSQSTGVQNGTRNV